MPLWTGLGATATAIFHPLRVGSKGVSLPRATPLIGTRCYNAKSPPPGTVRQRKRGQKSPSGTLIHAARSAGIVVALPLESPHKYDLSYISSVNAERKNHSANRNYMQERGSTPRTLSLQSVLATYILTSKQVDHACPSVSDGGVWKEQMKVLQLPLEHTQYLAVKGYGLEDVQLWASIYCENLVGVAATKLLAYSGCIRDVGGEVEKPLPTFLVLQLLRRSHMNPVALRCLLIYTSNELQRRKTVNATIRVESCTSPNFGVDSLSLVMNDSTMLILLIRLLRHARKCWPEALPTIAKLFGDYMDCRASGNSSRSTNRKKNKVAETAYLYNKALVLLSLPTSIAPFHSVALQQRAQFDLLQKMAQSNPPVPVTRAGYRAIVSTQLANKKTDREVDWDSLKAKSWPPWKEEKTGLDAEKEFEYGTSRALTALHRGREAGYGLATWSGEQIGWDKAAGVLAGWDLDSSPTIQTRTLLRFKARRRRYRPGHLRPNSLRIDPDDTASIGVWAARIRATRTIREAWACFIAVADRAKHAQAEIYFAMLEKLAYDPLRTAKNRQLFKSTTHEALPISAGDARETAIEPESPKEITYIRIEPPSFHELVEQMFQHGVVVTGHRLGFLLSHASTLRNGLRYVELASETEPRFSNILSQTMEHDNNFRNVPPQVVASVIGFLCRFPCGEYPDEYSSTENRKLNCIFKGTPPLLLALQFLRTLKPSNRSPWKAVIKVLGDNKVIPALGNFQHGHLSHFVHRWQLVQGLLAQMRRVGLVPDVETLLLTCRALESTIVAAHQAPQVQEADLNNRVCGHQLSYVTESAAVVLDRATEKLRSDSEFVRDMFHNVMGTGTYLSNVLTSGTLKNTSIPRLLASPNAPVLHVFIRMLGLLKDWQGIVDTVKWMVKYQQEIAVAIDMPRNGPRLLRRTIVAIRVFLEASWTRVADGKEDLTLGTMSKASTAPAHTIVLARRHINSVKAWGGWANDDEVDLYCVNGRFPGR